MCFICIWVFEFQWDVFWCSGIGIVNAIEVVNAFPEEDGLHHFREWIESPDPTILGKFDVQTGSNSRKRGSKVGENSMSYTKGSMEGLSEVGKNVLQADESKQSADNSQDIKKIFMDNHVMITFPFLSMLLPWILSFFTFSIGFWIQEILINREMWARIGIYLPLSLVKLLFQHILVHKWINQLSLYHGESQTFLFFASRLLLTIWVINFLDLV